MIDLRSSFLFDSATTAFSIIVALQLLVLWPTLFLTLLSLPTQTSFFYHLTITKMISVDLFFIVLAYFSEYALNFFRWFVYYPWVEYVAKFMDQWETFTWQQEEPLFYIDVQGYTSLTQYYEDHVNKAKLKKDEGPDEHAYFKFAKKSKRNIMTSVPNTMKRLIENDGLEIRTKKRTYLTHEHYRMSLEHSIATAVSLDSLKVTLWSWLYIFTDTLIGVGGDSGLMDEFWVNGKMVAYQTSFTIGEVLVDAQWAALPEARHLRLYFEANRLLLKRAIADPSVKYLNLQVMESAKESLCLPKRKMFARDIISKSDEDHKFAAMLCGFPDYIISLENLGLWWKMFRSIRYGEEFWNVKDESDAY